MSSNSERGDSNPNTQQGHGFGTAPVFLASICTILGAILFLRFGYAVAHVGLWGSLMIIMLGHFVTIPTVLAVSEIATNRRVAGGGAYYIVSRSFGASIGGTIGIALYISQAISVAFYLFILWRSRKLLNLSTHCLKPRMGCSLIHAGSVSLALL